ncbi:hypothetical protein F0726_01260 [Acidithiobacillus caldus]|nr:hypothetical protein F0726_01260 [Acidithiobacillus caldus]
MRGLCIAKSAGRTTDAPSPYHSFLHLPKKEFFR